MRDFRNYLGQIAQRNGVIVVTQIAPRPDGWDPKRLPDRHCPIWLRDVPVDTTCPRYCGVQYCQECKFADRDPKPDEMQTARPMIAGVREDWDKVQAWRKANSVFLKPHGGQ